MNRFHEHIIRVNGVGLTREMLWNGMENAARHPEKFVEHMESSSILSEENTPEGTLLTRKIDFGNAVFRDQVLLSPQESVKTVVEAGENWGASQFLMKIEEPEEGVFFVRFVYEEEQKGETLHPMYIQIRKQAYEAKDKKMIETILEKAER